MRKKPNVTIFVCVDCQMIVQLLIRKKLTFLWTDSVEAWNWIKPYFCINKVIDKMILPNIFFRVGLQTTEFKLEKIAWNQNQSKCYFLRESLASRSSILVGKMPKAWYFFLIFIQANLELPRIALQRCNCIYRVIQCLLRLSVSLRCQSTRKIHTLNSEKLILP